MFKHIVVGCDGSPEGSDAVALGAAIASATGARLSLVGVFPPSVLPITGVTDRKRSAPRQHGRFDATVTS